MADRELDEYKDVKFYAKHTTAKEAGFSKFNVDDDFYFCRYIDGKIAMLSQAYTSVAGRDNGIESVKKNETLPQRFRFESRGSNGHGFALKAGNGQEIAISPDYANLGQAQQVSTRMTGKAVSSGTRRVSPVRKAAPVRKVATRSKDGKLSAPKRRVGTSKTRVGNSNTRVGSSKPRTGNNEQNYMPVAAYRKATKGKIKGFETFRGEDGEYYFTYFENGKLALISEGYPTAAIRDVGKASVEKNMKIEKRYVFGKGAEGEAGFILRAGNHKEIARSVGYGSAAAATASAAYLMGTRRPTNIKPTPVKRTAPVKAVKARPVARRKPVKRPATKPAAKPTAKPAAKPITPLATGSVAAVGLGAAAAAKSTPVKKAAVPVKVAKPKPAKKPVKAAKPKPAVKKPAVRKAQPIAPLAAGSVAIAGLGAAAAAKSTPVKKAAIPVKVAKPKPVKKPVKAPVRAPVKAAKPKPVKAPVKTVKPKPAVKKPAVRKAKPIAPLAAGGVAVAGLGAAAAAAKSTPVKKPAPVKKAAVPVKATPVKPAPVKPAPVKPAPVKAAPIKVTPVKAAPIKPGPIKIAPVAAPIAAAAVASVAAVAAAPKAAVPPKPAPAAAAKPAVAAAAIPAAATPAAAGGGGIWGWLKWLLLALLALLAILFLVKSCVGGEKAVKAPVVDTIEPAAAPAAMVTCWNGSKAKTDQACPTKVTCWDGSFVTQQAACPIQPVAKDFKCWDGSMSADQAACPVKPVKQITAAAPVKADRFCGPSSNALFNVTSSRPKSVAYLGSNPQFGESLSLTPAGFYRKLETAYRTNPSDRAFLNLVARSLGYNSFRDMDASMFSNDTLPNGTSGMLGFGAEHALQFSSLNVTDTSNLEAFKVRSANGTDVHFMKRCGNFMYVCQP